MWIDKTIGSLKLKAKRNRENLLFGIWIGLLLLILNVIEYQKMANRWKWEVSLGVTSLLFLVFGLWLGMKWKKSLKKSEWEKNASNELLSKRESDVLVLLANGKSNSEIADALCISANTVKTHLASIYQKMGVQRRTQAMQKAIELGILNQPKG